MLAADIYMLDYKYGKPLPFKQASRRIYILHLKTNKSLHAADLIEQICF